MPSKVVVTVTNDLNQDQRMHRICDSLFSAGYDVTFVGRKKKSSSALLVQKFNQKRLSCIFDKGILFYFEYNIRLVFYLLFHKFDIGYSVDLDTIAPVGIVSLLKRNYHIHDAHEYFTEVPELQNKTIKKWIWNSIAKLFLGGCDLRFTVNEELAKELSEKYKYSFQVLRSVPLMNSDITIGVKDKIILYQGVLNKGRGIKEAISAIASMDEDVMLYIAGEGDLSGDLRAHKDSVDVNKKVHFLGWKLPNELKAITQKAWLGINLLDGNSLNYQYSLANKFFDYMHAGVPSINMDFPVYRRYCDEFNVGVCIGELSSESIKQVVTSLLNDESKYQSMVDSCLGSRGKQSWQVEEGKLLSSISKILKG